MATVDQNLNSGIKPVEIPSVYVSAQKKAMPIIQGNAVSLKTPGLSGQVQYAEQQQKIAKQKSAQARQQLMFQGIGDALQGGFNTAVNVLGKASPIVNDIAPAFTQMNNTVSQGTLGIRDSISSGMINSQVPILQAIGTATKIVDAIGDATGFHIDDVDKDSAKKAGATKGEAFLNNAMSAIPGMGAIMGALSPFKTNTTNSLSQEGESVMAGYSGTENDIKTSKDLSGKRTLFNRQKFNKYIDDTNKDISIINEIGRTNSLRKQSDYSRDLAQQNLNRYAGTNYQMHAIGKNGMKIMSKQELQAILATRKLQKGGVIGTDTNLLPEGALHARLHHLDEVNPNLEDVTKKGIPVLDSNGEQVAEIEKEELILRLELTKKIEELMKDGSDEAMIEAGKLLVNEIIENTQDNTGQLTEEVQNGN